MIKPMWAITTYHKMLTTFDIVYATWPASSINNLLESYQFQILYLGISKTGNHVATVYGI